MVNKDRRAFTKNDKNEISLTLEAAHSERRIVHIDDETGSVYTNSYMRRFWLKKILKSYMNIRS